MPYIPKKDYPPYQEPLDNLTTTLLEISSGSREGLLARFGYVVLETFKRTMPARRYFAFSNTHGIFHDMAEEMCRRFGITGDPYGYETYYLPDERLDPHISGLAEVINEKARAYNESATPPGSYPGAYAGLDNFPMTTLAERLVLALSPEDEIDLELLCKMPTLFRRLAKKFYREETARYEDEQIDKPTNGDLPETIEICRRLKKMRKPLK